MGEVTTIRGRGQAGSAAVDPSTGETASIATLIARAFGVLDGSAVSVHSPATADPTGDGATGRPRRHLHVVRDA